MSQEAGRKKKKAPGGGGTMYCYFYDPLQCIDSIVLNSFLLVAYPQIGSAYVKEGTMTLTYRSKSFFLGNQSERLIRFQFVNKSSFKL